MSLFKKSEEEIAAELATQEAQRAQRAARQAAAAEEKRQADYAASPAGRAAAARAAGRRYFQVVEDVATSQASATWERNVTQEHRLDQTGLIESVEDQGWTLHDVGYVFQETASDSKVKAIGSGERTAISGKIVAVYLFRVAGNASEHV